MGAGFVRFGGISALLVIAVIVVMIAVAAASPLAMQNKIVVALFTLVIYGMIIAVYLATKALWNSFGRNGANIPIIFMILMTIAIWVLGLFGGLQPGTAGRAANIIGIAFLVLTVLFLVAWFWFTIYCIVAGNSAGGIWKGAGILYLIGTLVGIVAAIIGIGAFMQLIGMEMREPGSVERAPGSTLGVAGGAAILGGIASLVLLGGWICHAIGLLIGAGKMDQARR